MREALEEARERGWRLAILSNSDTELIEASKERIGVPFDETVVASEIHSYKPAFMHWLEFQARTLADRSRQVHVGGEQLPRHRAGDEAPHPERLDQPARGASDHEPDPRAPRSERASPDTLDEIAPGVACRGCNQPCTGRV